MMFDPTLLKSVPWADRVAAQSLVMEILKEGGRITVNDGEEDTLTESRKFWDILGAMGTTDWDYLVVFDHEGNNRGYFWLIYNNGNEFDPMILISDYSANEYCDAIYRRVEAEMGGSPE